jgi:hypothetical protein
LCVLKVLSNNYCGKKIVDENPGKPVSAFGGLTKEHFFLNFDIVRQLTLTVTLPYITA